MANFTCTEKSFPIDLNSFYYVQVIYIINRLFFSLKLHLVEVRGTGCPFGASPVCTSYTQATPGTPPGCAGHAQGTGSAPGARAVRPGCPGSAILVPKLVISSPNLFLKL